MGINTSLCLNPELHILPVNSLQDKNSWDDSRTQEFYMLVDYLENIRYLIFNTVYSNMENKIC